MYPCWARMAHHLLEKGRAKMMLLAVPIQFGAIIAESIVICTIASFIFWYFFGWPAQSVIVMDTVFDWLQNLVDRVERRAYCHRKTPFVVILLSHKIDARVNTSIIARQGKIGVGDALQHGYYNEK